MDKNARFKKGDLVTIKPPARGKAKSLTPIGLVVEVSSRNPQNPDWDQLLVFMDGWIDAFPHRRLSKVFQI